MRYFEIVRKGNDLRIATENGAKRFRDISRPEPTATIDEGSIEGDENDPNRELEDYKDSIYKAIIHSYASSVNQDN